MRPLALATIALTIACTPTTTKPVILHTYGAENLSFEQPSRDYCQWNGANLMRNRMIFRYSCDKVTEL